MATVRTCCLKWTSSGEAMTTLWRWLRIVLLLALVGETHVYAQGTEAWIADSNGCKVWNPSPRPNESITWSGACVQGLATGQGTVQWNLSGRPAATGTGTFREGKLHGQGVTVAMNGDRYEGAFSNGRREGRGLLTSTSGGRYEGEFVEGKFSGSGVLVLPSGDRYEGNFVDGRRSGRGTYIWKSGDRYEGEFLDGKMHGSGSIEKANGERLVSDFKDGKAHGRATVTRPDGTRIAGEMTDGKFAPDSTTNQAASPASTPSSGSSDSAFHNSHSVESIRAALKSPIPQSILQQARQFDDQLVRSGKVRDQSVSIVTDSRHTRATQVVSTLLTAIRADPTKWVIRVLDTNPPQENAFVVGGNYIYVFTGLLNNAQSDDELAFILGHEISHSWLKHNLRRSEDFSNLLASLIEFSGAFTRNQNRKEQRALIGGAIKSAYSREDEQEADALGAYIAKRASYDPIRGIAFFQRMIQQENEHKNKIRGEFSNAKQTIDQQMANCQQLRAQWDSSPRVRTNQNAQIVNSTCQTAQANAQKYNAALNDQSRGEVKSILLRTHPADRDRIASLAASVDYLMGRRSLASLSGIGQGYNVYLAMDLK